MSQWNRSGAIAARLAVAALVAVSLPGCNSLRNAMGITKRPPDEFAVTTKAPLVVPPDYNLRPPQPGAGRPQEVKPEVMALQALFPDHVSNTPTAGETALLKASGAASVDPNVRSTVGDEQTEVSERGAAASKILYDVDVSAGGASADSTIERLDPQPVEGVR